MTPKPTIAFLGAGGTMGFAMARNIARANFPLKAWNRTRAKAEPLAQNGATVVDTPAQATQGADIVITMLTDADAVLEVGKKALPEASDQVIWLQMSTVGVSGTDHCIELAHKLGVNFFDAPVSGTKDPAEKGELIIMASGPEENRQELDTIFDVVGKKTVWLGAAGEGSLLKVVTNSWLLAVVEGVAETIALAQGTGIDPKFFLETVSDGPLDSPYLQMKSKAIINRDFEPTFSLSLAAKDADLAVELAQDRNLDLPLLKTIHDRLNQAVPEHGDEDVAVTYLTSAP